MKKIKVVLYWLWGCTWGFIMSFIGACGAIFCLCTGHKPHIYKGAVYFEIGKGWGGMEAGCFFFVNEGSSEHLKQHEWGHGIQNLIFGPLMPFIVCIPSAARYWFREMIYRLDQPTYFNELPSYDSFWVEAWATALGKHYAAKDEIKKN